MILKSKLKRCFAWILVVSLFVSLLPATMLKASGGISPIEVTLTVSTEESNLIMPIKLTVNYSKFSDLGLSGVTEDNPGKITPLHVLAAYYMQIKGATTQNIGSYISVDANGNVTSIDGKNGGGKWSFAVENKLSENATFSTKELTASNNLYIFGISENTKAYALADSLGNNIMGEGVSANIGIRAVQLDTYNKAPTAKTYDMTGTTPIIYKYEGNTLIRQSAGEDYTCVATAAKAGTFSITFNKKGTYYISGEKLEDNKNVITVPVSSAIQVVDKDFYMIEQDWASAYTWDISTCDDSMSKTTLYIWAGSMYGTPRNIISGNTDVLEISGSGDKLQLTPHRDNLTEDVDVPITVTMDLGKYHKEEQYICTVHASTALKSLKVEGVRDIQFNRDTLNYSVPVSKDMESVDISGLFYAENVKDKMALTVNGEAVTEGETYTYRINKTNSTDSVKVVSYRADYPSTKTTYTINFSMETASDVPDYSGSWTMGGVDNYNSYTVDALTPRNAEEIDKDASWKVDLIANGGYDIEAGGMNWGKWSYPIVVNQNIYIGDDTYLSKYDLNGNLIKSVEMPYKVLGGGYTGWLAYGGGYIYVPSGSRIMAFNADDLSMVWQGESGIKTGQQSSSQILYHDGYVYSGVTLGNDTGGGFYCFEASDDDKTVGSEQKDPVWVLEDGKSFYWAGAAVVGDYLLVPCDSGIVYSVDLKASIEAGEAVIADTVMPTGADDGWIRNSIVYDQEREQIYFTELLNDDSGYAGLFGVKFNQKTGKFGTVKQAEGVKTSHNMSVAAYNGRLYCIDASVQYDFKLKVLDADTLETIYTADGPYLENCLGFPKLTISTAYATSENDNTVYIYTNSNILPNSQYVLKDSESTTQGRMELLNETTYRSQFSTSQIVVADDGSLLYVNDSATLYCLKSTVTKEQVAVENVQDKINAIGTVSVDSQKKIKDARKAYNELGTDEQKASVNNYAVLTTAESTYENLLELKEIMEEALDGISGEINSAEEITALLDVYKEYITYSKEVQDSIPDGLKSKFDTLTAQASKYLLTDKGVTVSGDNLPWYIKVEVKTSNLNTSSVKNIEGKLEGKTILDMLEIKLINALTGEVYEPGDSVNVELTSKSVKGLSNVSILHLKEDGSTEVLSGNVNGDKVTFNTSSFSIFTIYADSTVQLSAANGNTKTGDNSPIGILILAVLISGVFIAVEIRRQKRCN